MFRNKNHVYSEPCRLVPSHLHFGKEILDRMSEYKDYVALIYTDTGETVTYSQLAQQTVDIALSLSRIGVGKGDVVSICSERRTEVVPTILGTFCVGATFTPSDITYGTAPLLHRIKISKPKVMFCSASAYDLHKTSFDTVGCIEKYIIYGEENKDGGVLFKNFLTETADVADFQPTPVDGWKDFLFILFSSGTTGLPKGVTWTHLAYLANFATTTKDSFTQSSVLVTREWYYSYGLSMTLSCLLRGSTIVFSSTSELKSFLQTIEKYQIKILQTTPTLITEFIKFKELEQYDVSSVEVILSSGTPASAAQVDGAKKRFPNLRGVYQLYSMTEAGRVCGELHAPLGPKHGSAGVPTPGCVLKVVDIDTRQPLGPNQRGEICLQSPSLFTGYIGIDNKDHLDSEGFYKTGDVGYYDDDKYFYVTDRVKELIKYNDMSVAPVELEGILVQHPRVREAGVVGAPRADCGEAPTAFVALTEGGPVAEGEIVEFLHSRISYKTRLAGGVRFVDRVPRVAGDKINRKALKLML